MNAGVGSTGAMEHDALLSQPLQYSNQLSLNRRLVRLNLPAVKIGAVVRDSQLEVAHPESVMSTGGRAGSSQRRADEPAPWLDSARALPAQRAIVGVVIGD